MVGVGAAEVDVEDVEDVEVVKDPTEAEEVTVVEVTVWVEELFKVVSVEVAVVVSFDEVEVEETFP
jgi:hypothetical protein